MGRQKKKRELNFKPIVERIGPVGRAATGKQQLNHDEVEAVYLMDFLGLYQEDAANKMGVSRPTLSNIIKSARKKIAGVVITGNELEIEDRKTNFIVAVPVDSKIKIASTTPKEKFLAFIEIEEGDINAIIYQNNPAYEKDRKPGIELPPLLEEKKVSYFFSQSVGAGLESLLFSKGINPVSKDIRGFDEIVETTCQKKD